MRISSFIGLRFLRSPRQARSISVVTWISGVGVMLGVTALIVSISVMNGFREKFFLSITGTMAHVRVTPDKGSFSGPDGAALLDALLGVGGVKAAAPYFSRQVFLRAGSEIRAVLLRGIDPGPETRVSELQRFVSAPLPDPDAAPPTLARLLEYPPRPGERVGIVLGRPLADALGLGAGDSVEVISTVQRITPIGPVPLIKRFRLAGVLETGMGAIDEVTAYVHLGIASRLHRAAKSSGGYSLRVADSEDIPLAAIRRAAENTVGENLRVVTWSEENKNLFQVMRLEKLGMFIVLTLIIVVGFFNIISSLIMLVLEKRKAIAVLMSMGASNKMVRRIFFMQGVWIGAVGTLAGLSLGLLICWAVATFDLVPLPPGVFPLARHLPVRVDFEDVALITACSFAICLLVTLYPASAAARTNPIENLRNE